MDFEVENKPTAKITDEMYLELMREFKKSMDIKEQADQMVLGARVPVKEPVQEKPHVEPVVPKEVEPAAPVVKQPEEK